MATKGHIRKPTSPLRDALRIFLGNKPAVLALLAILALALVGGSGIWLTGQPPTEDERAQIAEIEYVGDKVELERSSLALINPLDTRLEDKLLPPFTRSNADGKFYVLGTDHLGRDVLARLWSGSSISLTIGFLAVGISVLLGVALGGIAGYWGRSRVMLPFFLMLMSALIGGVAYAADFRFLAWIAFGAAGLLFASQLIVAILGRRWGAVSTFGVTLLLFASITGFNEFVERTQPAGKVMQQARVIRDMAYDTLIDTRDFGHDVKDMEDKVAGARSDEWRRKGQHEVELKFARLDVERARFNLVEREAAITLLERSMAERAVRAAHMDSINRPQRAEAERENIKKEELQLATLREGIQGLHTARTYAEAALERISVQDPASIRPQSSNELLDRRAALRQQFLDMFKADADNRLKGGLIGGKLLNGHWRNPVYRLTRHFIAAVILWLSLVVGILAVAGAAQGAARDLPRSVRGLFLPTITVDDLVMRFTEIMMTIPVLFLILAVLALFEKDVYIVMAVLGLTSWMTTTRFVRAEILSLREQDFIQAARALGVNDFRIIWRHLVPNAISPVLVSATLGVAGAVLAESTLSFLGIGARPDQPTWGQILSDGRAFMTDAWWLMVIPGLAILITVLSFNLLGEGLREAFNPKLRGR